MNKIATTKKEILASNFADLQTQLFEAIIHTDYLQQKKNQRCGQREGNTDL